MYTYTHTRKARERERRSVSNNVTWNRFQTIAWYFKDMINSRTEYAQALLLFALDPPPYVLLSPSIFSIPLLCDAYPIATQRICREYVWWTQRKNISVIRVRCIGWQSTAANSATEIEMKNKINNTNRLQSESVCFLNRFVWYITRCSV